MRTIQKKKSIYWAFGIIAIALLLLVLYSVARHPESRDRHPREGEDPGSQESRTADTIRENDEIQKEAFSSTTVSSPVEDKDSRLDSRLRGNDTTDELRRNDVGVATLTIFNESIEFPLTEEMTVYDAMNLLKEENKITFEGKNYPGLGFFVTSINSISAGGGKNLFYYINGEEASVGISTYQIKEGDIIEWKLK